MSKISYSLREDYEIENPEELFGPDTTSPYAILEPTLDRIDGAGLSIFRPDGKEIRPFGGNNYTSGYIYDFNQDGILERADSTNYSLKAAPDHDISTFELQTIERKPRTLLNVIFNWHPDSADDENSWDFECYDDNADGIAEIAFGPEDAKTEAERRQIVFRYDKATATYLTPDLPDDPHIRIIAPGETLKAIAKSNPPSYPLVKDSSEESAEPIISTQKRYVFDSLKDAPFTDILAFFDGKEDSRMNYDLPGAFPSTLPAALREMSPRDAAFALANSNRTHTHTEEYQLAIDDRDGVSTPTAGWITYSWGSSGCYSYSSDLFALRYGTGDPLLVRFSYNSIGVVGRNDLADQPAHALSLYTPREKDAVFLADTLFWLDRIRSRRADGEDNETYSSYSSSADGSASIDLLPNDKPPHNLANETVWAGNSISGRWNSEYSRTIFVNLAHLTMKKGLPEIFGETYVEPEQLRAQSLTTPTEERLDDRIGETARLKLSTDLADLLKLHKSKPIPTAILRKIIYTASGETLTDLLPALEELAATLPPPTAEEKELVELEKRFEHEDISIDPLGDAQKEDPNGEKAARQKAFSRMVELREEMEFNPAHQLRGPLANAIHLLKLGSDTALLKQEILDEGPHASWALGLLRRSDPESWALLISTKMTGEIEDRRQVLNTLISGHPPTAVEMIRNFSPDERLPLIVDIYEFHKKNSPEEATAELPLLLEYAKNRKNNSHRRGSAMTLLSEAELSPEILTELRALLAAEIQNPQNDDAYSSTLSYALQAITNLPDPAQHLEFLSSIDTLPEEDFGAGFEALEIMTRDHPDREKILADFIRTQFAASKGMMESVFIKALTYDLQSLSDEIATFATESQSVEDGDGANYSGGNFKTPAGQRYHIAREITALWSETDPATLAKMWIAFAVSHPGEFQAGWRNKKPAQTIRATLKSKAEALPAEVLKETIAEAIQSRENIDYFEETIGWLQSLPGE